jgi:hypothetical protein
MKPHFYRLPCRLCHVISNMCFRLSTYKFVSPSESTNNTGTQKIFSFPVKIQDDSYSFDIAESEYENQIALSSANIKVGWIKLKKYVCN